MRKKRNGLFLELLDRVYKEKGLLFCRMCKEYYSPDKFYNYASNNSNYGKRFYCINCEKIQRFNKKDKIKQSSKIRNSSLKDKFINLAGNCCQRCGYNEFISGLEFHHVYKHNKEYNPGYIIMSNNFEKCFIELNKCCLLCANCHNGYEASEWKAEFIKREGLGYTVGESLPLDDNRYDIEKPDTISSISVPSYVEFDVSWKIF